MSNAVNDQFDEITMELWNSINKMSEEEKENWKVESFSHLRQLLVKEMDILSELYKPLDMLVKENLKSDNKGKGQYLYNEWGTLFIRQIIDIDNPLKAKPARRNL